MTVGVHEAPGRSTLAVEWFEALQAPTKQLIVFDRSGHNPERDEPGQFAEYLTDVVLAETEASP